MRGPHIQFPVMGFDNSTDELSPSATLWKASRVRCYSDWPALLHYTTYWCEGITLAIMKLLPASALYYLNLMSREVKDYLMQVIVYISLLGQMEDYDQQLAPCVSSPETPLQSPHYVLTCL